MSRIDLTLLLLLLLFLALNSKDKLGAWVSFRATPHAMVHVEAPLLYLEMHMYQSLSSSSNLLFIKGPSAFAPDLCVSSRVFCHVENRTPRP